MRRRGDKTRKPRGSGWYGIVVLSGLGWVVLYASRTVFSPALGVIGAEWGLDEAQLGLISSLFFLAYAAMQIPTGLLADKIGKGKLLSAGLLLFGVTTAARGLSPTYGMFLLAGCLAGLGQGTYYATQFALSSAAIPQARRGLGLAIIHSGMAVGSSAGMLVGSLITFGLGWGWRSPFLVIATMAVALVAPFYRLTSGSNKPRAPSASEFRRTSVRAALTKPLLVAYAINFASLYAFFMFLAWLPYFLETERGFPASATGLIASLVPWASIPGGVVVSMLSDRLGDRLPFIRVMLPVSALAVLGIAAVDSAGALYALLVLYGLAGKSTIDPLLVTRVSEVTPAARLATALGFLNTSGMAASVIAPYVTGLITRATGRMEPAFYLAAAILAAGSIVSLVHSRRGTRVGSSPAS